jgi:hypothetical protein
MEFKEIKPMRVLVACEYSGTVRDAFKAKGHYAMSVDLLPTDVPGEHHQGDVLEVLDKGWDLMIAHPPCTYLTNSGVRWLSTEKGRWEKMEQAAEFFKTLLNSPINKIAIENPIPHKYAMEIIQKRYDQIIQPHMFGHMETKATCLWLKNLPKLQPTKDVKDEMLKLPKKEYQKVHYLPPSPMRWKIRSTTYAGIAEAMAEQWG